MTDVEVDEVLCLVCDEGSEGPADDAVPCWVVGLVEFLLDERGDVLFDVEGVECLDGCVDGLVLHVIGHIDVLNDCALVLTHFFYK